VLFQIRSNDGSLPTMSSVCPKHNRLHVWAFAGAAVDVTLADMPGAVPLLRANISDVRAQVAGWGNRGTNDRRGELVAIGGDWTEWSTNEPPPGWWQDYSISHPPLEMCS
jgi:hypothetical protein